MLFTGNQPPCRLGIIRHQSRFLAIWHVKANFWCVQTPTSATGEMALCVQLGDCSYHGVIMWRVWVVAFPKTLSQGDGGSAGSTGESPALYPVGEQGDALAQSSTRNQSQVPGLCSTLGLLPHSHAGKLLPEYPTPAVRMQRYMEFGGTNTTIWDHCIWKCAFSCIKSSVHMQSCKG